MSTLTAGLATGLATGVVAAGAAIVFRATRTLHLAVGPIVITGLLVHLTLAAPPVGAPLVVALLGGGLVAAVLSAALEPLVLGPLEGELGRLIGVAAAGAAVAAVAGRVLGARTVRPTPLVGVDDLEIAGLEVAGEVLAALVVGLPLALALGLLAERGRWGRRLRLVGGEPRTLERVGVSPRRVRAAALAVSGAAGTVAVAAAAPVTFAGLPQAAGLTLAAVAVVVVAEARPTRAVGVGVALGLVEATGQSLWPAAGGDVAVGAAVVVALVLRGGDHVRSWGRAW